MDEITIKTIIRGWNTNNNVECEIVRLDDEILGGAQ